MSIRCGRGPHRHETAAEVRACYNGEQPSQTAETLTADQRATEKQVRFLGSLLVKAGAHLASGEQLDQLPKRTASQLIDGMLGYLKHNDLIPAGVVISVTDGTVSTERNPLPDVAAGHYAIASLTGNNDLDFFRVDRPTEGRWAGRTFVHRVIGGRSDSPVRGSTAQAALKAIAEDPEAAGNRYADELGRCRNCNRHLTDELSRQRRYGPDCFGQLGR